MATAAPRQGTGPQGSELLRLARLYDTDKADHPHYLRNYEECFGGLTGREVRLLELGVKSGGSLLLWRDYFPKGVIVGLDINPVRVEDASGRVRTYQGAQQDTATLDRVAREAAPEGFDIIIDDCSHIGVLTRVSFWHLFEHHLKSGGLYVIEDWGTGYWGDWVDGVGYRPRGRGYSPLLYRAVRALARLQRIGPLGRAPLVGRLLGRAKAAAVRRQHRSHGYGMVGFVKELVDELGMGDITDPRHGRPPSRRSKFADMKLFPSHLFVTKA